MQRGRAKRAAMSQKMRRNIRVAAFRPRPPCPLLAAGIREVDYKNLSFLRRYLGDEWKIQPGRINNLSARMQRQIAAAIKRARYLALLPYTERHHIKKER
jgi:small subunit ribosomal protein S18